MLGLFKKTEVGTQEGNLGYNPYPYFNEAGNSEIDIDALKQNILNDPDAVNALKGAAGPAGAAGANGTNGTNGTNGKSIQSNNTDPTTSTVAAIGDLFLNTANGTLYERSSMNHTQFFNSGLPGLALAGGIVWLTKGNLKGPTGPAGAAGANGTNGLSVKFLDELPIDTQANSHAEGQIIILNNFEVYVRNSVLYNPILQRQDYFDYKGSIVGPQGNDGENAFMFLIGNGSVNLPSGVNGKHLFIPINSGITNINMNGSAIGNCFFITNLRQVNIGIGRNDANGGQASQIKPNETYLIQIGDNQTEYYSINELNGQKGTNGVGYDITFADEINPRDINSATLTANKPHAYIVSNQILLVREPDFLHPLIILKGSITAVNGLNIDVIIDEKIEGSTYNQNLSGFKMSLTGAKGAAGANGTNGTNGTKLKNFGESLFENINYEHGNLDGFENPNNVQFELLDSKNVIKVINFTTSKLTNSIRVDTNYLYKLEVYTKNTGTAVGNINFYPLNENNQIINTGGTISINCINVGLSTTFVKRVGFVGGIGTLVSNFEPNTVKLAIVFNKVVNSEIHYHSLVVSKVNISEPVPYNLPYLPEMQEVYDPATKERGYYDGTNFHWYTMQA